MILIPFVVLLVRVRAAAALLAVRPRRLRHRPQQRGRPLHRRQRRAHQVLAVRALPARSPAFAGVYYTLRYGSARGDNATGLELQVIAAVLLGGVSIFGGRGALHGVVAGVLLIGVISSALRLESVTVNVINIVIGVLLVLSVMSTSLLGWVASLRPRRGQGTHVHPGVGQPTPQHRHHALHRAPRKGINHEAPNSTDCPRSRRSRSVAGLALTGLRRRRRRRRQRRTAAAAAATSPITFLPKNLGNPYFDTSDAGGEAAIEEFGGTYEEVGPDTGSPDAPGAVHQHRRPAGRRRPGRLGQRPRRDLRRAQRGPRRRRQGRHLRLRHRPGLPRPVRQPGHAPRASPRSRST